MAAQKTKKPLMPLWTSKGIASTLTFLIAAFLLECAIILYANILGVTENPATRILGVISPLFHLIPATVVITLTFTWTYLTRCIAMKSLKPLKKATPIKKGAERPKNSLPEKLKIKIFCLKQKIANAPVKSAITVLLLFTVFAFAVSLLAYPRLIYEAVIGAYRNNEAFLNFVKGATEALVPIFWLFSTVGNAFILLAPAFRDFVLALGGVIGPLASTDATEKYVVLQNAAVWISALLILIYGGYVRKGLRYRMTRKG